MFSYETANYKTRHLSQKSDGGVKLFLTIAVHAVKEILGEKTSMRNSIIPLESVQFYTRIPLIFLCQIRSLFISKLRSVWPVRFCNITCHIHIFLNVVHSGPHLDNI